MVAAVLKAQEGTWALAGCLPSWPSRGLGEKMGGASAGIKPAPSPQLAPAHPLASADIKPTPSPQLAPTHPLASAGSDPPPLRRLMRRRRQTWCRRS